MKSSIFEEVGLNEKEAIAYNLLLEHGQLTPPRLAEITDVTRQNAYAILKSLVSKELIEEITIRKKLTYRLLHPFALVRFTEDKKAEAETSEKIAKSALPELTSLFHLATNKPGVSFFEGVEGVKKIYEDVLKEKPEEVLVLRSILDERKLDKYLLGFTKRRSLYGINTRIISPKKVTKELEREDIVLKRQRKYIPEDLFKLSTEVSIYNDQVAFIAFEQKLMGFVVSSKDVAQTFRTIFELIWRSEFSSRQKDAR